MRQQVEQADQLVKDAQAKVDDLITKMNQDSNTAQELFEQADNLEKSIDYERQGLEVPTWCSTAEITKLANQAQDALDSSAEWSRQGL